MSYGIPYKGSKNSIAEKVLENMPSAEYFVDLFAGGCAITHAAMLSGKYQKFIINDINPMPTQLFVDCINGNLPKPRWVSRKDFSEEKDKNPLVKYCWSFGNNGRDYMYGKDIEPYKRALHAAVVDDNLELLQNMGFAPPRTDEKDLKKRRLFYTKWAKTTNPKERGLEVLERLERLQSLEQLERPERFSVDYQDVIIPENSVIYCDIPYRYASNSKKNTEKYGVEFNYERFYVWAKEQKNIYISEYWMPDGFECIAEIERSGHMSATNNSHKVVEKLFVPKK